MYINISLTGLNPASQSRNFEKVQMDFHELHTVTGICNYSPIIWKNGIRKADNFISADMLILDMDGSDNIEDTKKLFSKTKNVLFVTSKSHQKSNKVTDDGSDTIPQI